MADENKNLENERKKDGNWMFTIGIILFSSSVTAYILLNLFRPVYSNAGQIGIGVFLFGFFIFSLFLIFTSLLLKSRNKWIKIISLIILIILIAFSIHLFII